MKQGALPFDITAKRHKGNPQSREANLAAIPRKENLREIIFNYILKCGERGSTADEAEIALGIRTQTLTARVAELKAQERIVPYGTRPTRSGCNAAVLYAVEVWQRMHNQ